MMIQDDRNHRWLLLCMIFLFVSFICFGCGGSSGGDGDDNGDSNENSNDLLDGTYFLNFFANAGDGNWNQMDEIAFDGAGGLDSDIVLDSSGDSGGFSGAYEMAADGTFTITNTDVEGILSPDGNMVATIDTDPTDEDTEISIGAGVAASAGSDATLLNDTYILCQIRHDGDAVKASRISVTFDGAGALTGSILADSDDGPGGNLTGTYTVATNGRVGMTITGLSKTFEGIAAPDGNSLVILDDDDDGEVLLMVGMKTSSGMSVASLSGDFQVHVFGGDASNAWTSLADASADGQGGLSVDTIAASDDDTGTREITYTVEADGTFTITETGETGILAPSGDMFVVVDADTEDDEVSIVLGIKKM